MPDAPDKPLDPKAIARQQQAERDSKPYRNHPQLTVRQFLRLDYQGQREADAECERLLGLEYHTVKPVDGPPYIVGKKPDPSKK